MAPIAETPLKLLVHVPPCTDVATASRTMAFDTSALLRIALASVVFVAVSSAVSAAPHGALRLTHLEVPAQGVVATEPSRRKLSIAYTY